MSERPSIGRPSWGWSGWRSQGSRGKR